MNTYNKTYDKNIKGRDFVIGDLHGCYDELQEKLLEINFDKSKDRMFSVGDLIDRGDDSLKCLQLIDENWFHSIIGNHEDMMIDSVVNHASADLWYANGGTWASEYYNDDYLYSLAYTASTLPYSMTIETEVGFIGICHAQPPSDDWLDVEYPDDIAINNMLWARWWIANQMPNVDNIYKTIHGHTPVKEVEHKGNVIFIDTGAVFKDAGGFLTCLELNKL